MDSEQISFKIISSAGDSFAEMIQALECAKKGNHEEALARMDSAKEILREAHKAQMDMLVSEANGTKPEFSILLVHAQDHLMNAVLAETLISQMIDIVCGKGDK